LFTKAKRKKEKGKKSLRKKRKEKKRKGRDRTIKHKEPPLPSFITSSALLEVSFLGKLALEKMFYYYYN
jgi:hypothetical protein